MKKQRNANLPAAILVLVLLMLWQLGGMKMNAAYILPTPVQVVVRLWELRGPLFTAHLPATMQVVFVGLAISVVLGMGLAILMDLSPMAEKALYPLIIASQTIPTTALAPLFVLWFGYTMWSKVLVTVLMTFFPIAITVFDGLKSVKSEMTELMSIIGAAIGEWLGAKSGLGYFSRRMMTQLDGAGVFAPILLLSVVAMILTGIVSVLEKRIVTWRGES